MSFTGTGTTRSSPHRPAVVNQLFRDKAYGHLSARDLELRATVVYVVRDLELQGTIGDNGRVKEVVENLKPRFGAREIEDSILELDRKGYLPMAEAETQAEADQGL